VVAYLGELKKGVSRQHKLDSFKKILEEPMKRLLISAIIVVIVLALGKLAFEQKRSSSSTPSSSSSTISMTEADRELDRRIRDSLIKEDPSLANPQSAIYINVENGIVRLHGRVKSEQEKESIAAKVKSLEGVEEVENRLATWPGGCPNPPCPDPIDKTDKTGGVN
jgi:hypothetical protein